MVLTIGPRTLGRALLAVVFGAMVVVSSGVIPLKASSGHWAITAWFLHTAFRRSVATHAMGIEAPPLDDAQVIRIGAGHYHGGCLPCHGAPGVPTPPVAAAMTPPPPRLEDTVPTYDLNELFYVVKHGVKFTGMPAWPALTRDDEVWAVVAFLQTLPALDAAGYQDWVFPPEVQAASVAEPAPPTVRDACARCHGYDGSSPSGAFPVLAGQSTAYLAASLEAYARGERSSGIMEPLAALLTADQIAEVSRYYAAQRPPAARAADRTLAARGERLAHGAERTPRCVACHGPGEGHRSPQFPALSGQPERYLARQLELFEAGQRGGTGWAEVMTTVAHRSPAPHDHLTPEQISALAAYYAASER